MRGKRKMKNGKIYTGMTDRTFDIIVTVFISIFMLIELYPMIYVVSSSFSSADAITSGRVLLWPVDFAIDGYKQVVQNEMIWVGLKNAIFYTAGSTIVTLILTLMCGYCFSRNGWPGKKFLNMLYLVTVWFGGGMIPNYILTANLGLVNTPWVFIVGAGYSFTNVIIVKTYFQTSIPGELLEASQVDGITDIGYFLRIALPLSKPVTAVIATWKVVAVWNAYMGPLIYLRDRELWPLQLVIEELLRSAAVNASQFAGQGEMAAALGNAEVMKYALIVFSTVPMLLALPVVLKYFEKGMTLGSLKG